LAGLGSGTSEKGISVKNSLEDPKLIDGKLISARLKETLKVEVAGYLVRGLRKPGLAVILVGEDPASCAYVKSKINTCKALGIESYFYQYPADATEAEVVAKVSELNKLAEVDGILVQLPLPGHINSTNVIAAIDSNKDVDGLTTVNMGRLAAGQTGLFPCTPCGVMEMLKFHEVPLKGANALVIGRSHLVGKPVALMLLQEDATVTIAHSKTRDLKALCLQADIVVAAVGRPLMVKGDWIAEGAVVIDVGINRIPTADGKGQLVGDVDFAGARERASLITPVPGGVGPMTVALLMANTVKAYKMKLAL
jgi:methylenetetrahydrofolate dehydrogenase (NADP+)/methenyltetrahydrofolate cyclohydrolase